MKEALNRNIENYANSVSFCEKKNFFPKILFQIWLKQLKESSIIFLREAGINERIQ